MENPEREGETLITLADCWKCLKTGFLKILMGAVVCATLLISYSVTRPVQYEAEGTFKEKGNAQANMSAGSLTTLLLSGFNTGNKGEAKGMMLSRKLLGHVIATLDLQANLVKKNNGSILLKHFGDNLITEYAYLRRKVKPPIPDAAAAIRASAVHYEGEYPVSLTLVFNSEDNFTAFDEDGGELGIGVVGTPFAGERFGFTVVRQCETPISGSTYVLSLLPVETVAKALSKNIHITAGKDDSSMLTLKYCHPNRHAACAIVNQLMLDYQNYLRSDQKRLAGEQIAYLNKREGEMMDHLLEKIEDFAGKVASEVKNQGFPDSRQAMEFFSGQMQRYQQKLLEIDLELRRFQRLREENAPFDSRYLSLNNPANMNEVITRILALKHNSDSIELALRTSPKNPDGWNDVFHRQVGELDEVRRCSNDTKTLLVRLDSDEPTFPSVSLLDNPRFMVRAWIDQLQEYQNSVLNADAESRDVKKEEWKALKAQFGVYLTTLLHFLEVSEKTIQERLAHQQAPQEAFQGINLETAKDLYIAYSRELSDVEAKVLQMRFLIEQLKDPEFEISSMSYVVDDPVTRGMIEKSSAHVLALQDDANRSLKEKERLKKELQTQKRFLDLHLNQTIQLLVLRENLLKDKIESLQNVTLELIRQNVSILEKQVADSIDTHIGNLQQARDFLELHSLDLRHEMSALPRKWASEKIIEQQVRMNAVMVEELTRLVESKNIASNLETVQSAPVDLAVPPTHPLRPRIIYFSVLGSLLGALLTSASLLAGMVVRGVPASLENLALAGVPIAGSVSGDEKSTLATVRRMFAHFDGERGIEKAVGRTVLLVNGDGVDCSQKMAEHLAHKGMKVLILDLSFSQRGDVGLLQYLRGESPALKVSQEEFVDRVSSGGLDPYAFELLCSKRFKHLLKELSGKYDWVIATAPYSPAGPEAENLLGDFDYAVFNIAGETLKDLGRLIERARSRQNLCFVLTET